MTEKLGLVLLFLAAQDKAAAQNSTREFWPELNMYANQGGRIRVVFHTAFNHDQDTRYREGKFGYYLDVALRPVFRRELRRRDDVFRSRFLTFRAGYEYITSLVQADTSSENRAVAETTARYPLPAKFVIIDRNRGDFRWVKGQPFSMRYRNRLWIEHDLEIGRLVFTPFVYDEIFYYTQHGAWNRNDFAFGVQVPAGPHVVFEPHFIRKNDSRSTPRYVNALAFTLNLYF